MDVPGLYKRIFYKEVKWYDEYGAEENISRTMCVADEAEVVSSEVDASTYPGIALTTGLHSPVLDIDIPAYLVPSGTRGHSHLYFDHLMTWRQYKRLLKALGRAGILEDGYVKASIRRGHTSVRVPWRPKLLHDSGKSGGSGGSVDQGRNT